MVVIRLARGGDKKSPFYRIVVADKRFSRNGRYIEQIGYYDPMARGKANPIELDLERVTHWQDTGAQFSEKVKSLVKIMRSSKGIKAAPCMSDQKLEQAEKAAKAHKQKQAEALKAAAAAAAEAEAEETTKSEDAPEKSEDASPEKSE